MKTHIRWTGNLRPALCGEQASLLHCLDASTVNLEAPNLCLACLQMFSELSAYRSARLAGMREPLAITHYLANPLEGTHVPEKA